MSFDLEQWQLKNRAPLFSGKKNTWILARTLRDNPTEKDVKETLLFCLVKWFEGNGVDVLLSSKSGDIVSNGVDGIKVKTVSKTRPTLKSTAARRENLPYGPIPTVNGQGGVAYVEVEFNYRASLESLPWPVRTAPGLIGMQLKSSAEHPIDADWILLEVGKPEEPSAKPPTGGEIVLESALKPAAEAVKMTAQELIGDLWLPLIIGGAIGAWWLLKKK